MFRKEHYIPKQIAKASVLRVMKANKCFFVNNVVLGSVSASEVIKWYFGHHQWASMHPCFNFDSDVTI